MCTKELQKELVAMDAVQSRLRALLTEIALIIKGPAKPGEPHDWHDLPSRVEKLLTEHKHLRAWWAEHMARTAAGYEQLAVDLEAVRREAEAEGYRRGVVEIVHKMQGRLRALPEPDVVDAELLP